MTNSLPALGFKKDDKKVSGKHSGILFILTLILGLFPVLQRRGAFFVDKPLRRLTGLVAALWIFMGMDVVADPKEIKEFESTGSEVVFPVNSNITKLWVEVYGGRGGTKAGSGYGAKVSATFDLSRFPDDWDRNLYINVAGNATGLSGGYNGGGIGQVGTNNGNTTSGVGGGGASHIALSSGLLASFSGNQSAVLVAAGGGGGAMGNPNYTNLNTHPNEAGYGHGGKTGQNGLRTFQKRKYGKGGTQLSGGTTNEGQGWWGGEPNGSFGQGGYIGPETYGFGYSWEPSNGG
ncbi:MAG: glycine-rich protein, partial [Akkermansiaceae bacterium]|nr:glycine-rich protein [Akkermansiaceae bacterium]